MSNQVCEIKSVRDNLLNEISNGLLSEEEYYESSELFKILSDFNRLRLMDALNTHELCVCELSLLLDMSQSAISHQLRQLRHKKIVNFRKENKKVFYSISDNEIIFLLNKLHNKKKSEK
ncbi:ArsR/SmtB family transcription factor [Methanobrevibacter curvatus]|uniref:HTH arsR-type domain-containing protein n=1 Tax=Methanobrevibacter curvatus TaxID=49547 RepID=A0A166CHA6_9EURY|nr:metalloregulator ArsR/SmtB family transcription factor [Methanobrevibacter curvatus]KZX14347.1 hypothetical protein MBCUR_05710 [Methanobrevibacter curvatus]